MLYFWNPDDSLTPNMMIDTSPWSSCSRRSPWSPWLPCSSHTFSSTGPSVSPFRDFFFKSWVFPFLQIIFSIKSILVRFPKLSPRHDTSFRKISFLSLFQRSEEGNGNGCDGKLWNRTLRRLTLWKRSWEHVECGLHPHCGVLFIVSGKKRMLTKSMVSFIRMKKPSTTRKEEATFAEKGPAWYNV